jgi:hypothetical protein
VLRFKVANVRSLGTALALASAALCGSAGAQTVSDELQIVLPSGTMTYTAINRGIDRCLRLMRAWGSSRLLWVSLRRPHPQLPLRDTDR